MTSPDPFRQPIDAREAFEELGRIALNEYDMTSVLQRVADLAVRVVPGAREVSVTLLEGGRPQTVVFTGALAKELDETQYERGHGPCLAAAEGAEVMIVSDARVEDRWPDYTPRAVAAGSVSSMSLPVPLQSSITAALNVYGGAEPSAFGADSVELGQTFAAYCGVAIANMHLYQSHKRLAEHLTTAMQSRAVIDQAKGILMGERHCSAADAFDLLVRLSQDSNRKLRDVAQALVERTEQSADPTTTTG